MIEIWTEVLPPSFYWDPYKYLGGTIDFVVNTAECCRDECIVYYDGPAIEKNGVFYLPRKAYKGQDVVLSCNSKPPHLGKYNIAWVNWYHERDVNYLEFDERITQSPYHQSIFGYNSRIVPSSCWPNQFNPNTPKENICLFSSSPDRGKDFLTNIWPEVKQKTGYDLICTYDLSISEQEMIDLYNRSRFWLHPGFGIELFCISAVKAQVAGCIPIVVPNMALATTVKFGIKTTLEKYKEDLIKTLLSPPNIQPVDFGSWQIVTDQLFEQMRKI